MADSSNARYREFGDAGESGGAAQADRSLVRAMSYGARGKCPHCGRGRLYSRYLAVVPACSECGEDLHFHRADDLPAYLNIFVTGHVVVGTMLLGMDWELLPMWGFTVLTAGVAVGVSAALMRPLKGMVVGAQWALRMHGFGGDDD
jgi:uncharacterized protein (DUF983 family)